MLTRTFADCRFHTGHIVFKYIMTLVPKHVPFFVRPLIKLICGQISSQAADPSIKKELAMVRVSFAFRY